MLDMYLIYFSLNVKVLRNGSSSTIHVLGIVTSIVVNVVVQSRITVMTVGPPSHATHKSRAVLGVRVDAVYEGWT